MEKAPIQQTVEAMPGLKLLTECERYKPEVGFTCKAMDIGLESFVQCLEKSSRWCPFSVPYGHSNFCKSPARVYVAKELKR
ncbi:MAG: hypothetical protein JSV01_06225 [Desulfobacterales bacterium]|jgi:hypothetical protein|nr:MAG: hypothetical protein JSV01_06225 [Desulfobacterales bacterium]UCG80301.1 MAG: hypothetical protein JSV60_10105 [Desulfobacterales bacterium]